MVVMFDDAKSILRALYATFSILYNDYRTEELCLSPFCSTKTIPEAGEFVINRNLFFTVPVKVQDQGTGRLQFSFYALTMAS